MATDYIDKNPLNPIEEHNEASASRKNEDNVKPIASETNVIIDEPALTKDKERVTSLVGHPDHHWSWYGYSRGYVQDGFIRDDNKFVIKERFVGNSSFLFNHKDYTNTTVHDYFKNMDVKRKHAVNDALIQNDHDLKIGHLPKSKMKSPDVFKTNVNIKSTNNLNTNDDKSRFVTNENHIDDTKNPVTKNDDKRIVTEYADEINVTILKEDIEIDETPVSMPELHENEVRHVYLTAASSDQIENDLMNSFEQISYEYIIDQKRVEETTVEEILTENSNSSTITTKTENEKSVETRNNKIEENKSDETNDTKGAEFAILSSTDCTNVAVNTQQLDKKKAQNSGSFTASSSICELEKTEENLKPNSETESVPSPPTPTNGVVKFNNVTLIHHHDESKDASPIHKTRMKTEEVSQAVEKRSIQSPSIENPVVQTIHEEDLTVKEGQADFRWDGVLRHHKEEENENIDENENRDGSDDYVVIDFEGCDSAWRENLNQSVPVEVGS